jgi:hypothetical protein
MSEVREKLFDTTNRLSRCTSLLQRMVEENAKLRYTSYSLSHLHSRSDLREKISGKRSLKRRCPGTTKDALRAIAIAHRKWQRASALGWRRAGTRRLAGKERRPRAQRAPEM